MKDEDSTKVKIDTKIDFTILDNENLQIVTSHQSALNDIVAARQVEVMRLKDEGIRQALVKLGWTPPGMAPSIHEDNARSLQGIIDGLRIILGAADGERITDAARRTATKRPAQATQVEVTDEREAFESCALMAGSLFKRRADDPDKYWDGNVQDDWELWQARAILALRPERVPMTPAGRDVIMATRTANADADEWPEPWAYQRGWNDAEAHHGITAQAKKEQA